MPRAGKVAGVIESLPLAGRTAIVTGDSHRFVAARHPGRRWGTPDDVANLVEWLASPAAAWITGQTLVSDGGWMLRTGVPPAVDPPLTG